MKAIARWYRSAVSFLIRLIRAGSALIGGLLREFSEVALPASLRRTSLYHAMVEVVFHFLIAQLGQVKGVYPDDEKLAQNFLVQRTASHGIELLGILTLHLSPVWVLAILADATGAGHNLIREISQELKAEGLLPADARSDTIEELLTGLENTSAHLAKTLNLPPTSLPALRQEWDTLRAVLPRAPELGVPGIESLDKLWRQIRESARQQHRSVFTVSSSMALSAMASMPGGVIWLSRATGSAAKRTGRVFGSAILDHYSQTIQEIADAGFLAYWKRQFRPYVRAARRHLSPTLSTPDVPESNPDH